MKGKRGSTVADSAQGQNRMNDFFWEICRETTKVYGEK